MRATTFGSAVIFGLVSLGTGVSVHAGNKDVAALMKLVPADFPLTVVAVNMEKFDKSMSAAMKRFNPDATQDGLADQIRELPLVGEWVDLSKPIAMAGPNFGGDSPPVVWARISDFANKIKAVDGAEKTENVWHLPRLGAEAAGGDANPDTDSGLYLRQKGDYIVMSQQKDLLTKAFKDGRTLADDFASRMDLLEGRDLLAHINIDPVRATALGGIAQAGQMVPMIAMMAAQQGGGDPQTVTAVFTTVLDAAKKFVEQLAYVDVTVGLSDDDADITIATTYKEGAIKDFLAGQKPASVPFFTDSQDRPFMVAFGAHLPGDKSAFMKYITKQVESALAAAPAGAGGGQANGDATAKLKDAIHTGMELLGNLDGEEVIVSASAAGLEVIGDYLGSDPVAILKLVNASMKQQQELAKQAPGFGYETLNAETIEGIKVSPFRFKIDPSNPAAALFGGADGQGMKFGLGVRRGRVRFGMGNDEVMARAFGGKPSTPLASSKHIVAALTSLPTERNAVFLIDLAPTVAMLGPMVGMPKMDPIPPGAPIAISLSLTGEPARLDVHIPFRAIERLLQALAPEQPM